MQVTVRGDCCMYRHDVLLIKLDELSQLAKKLKMTTIYFAILYRRYSAVEYVTTFLLLRKARLTLYGMMDITILYFAYICFFHVYISLHLYIMYVLVWPFLNIYFLQKFVQKS